MHKFMYVETVQNQLDLQIHGQFSRKYNHVFTHKNIFRCLPISVKQHFMHVILRCGKKRLIFQHTPAMQLGVIHDGLEKIEDSLP